MSERMGARALAGLVIVLTFVVGGLAGAVADRALVRPASAELGPPGAPPGGPPGSRRDRGERGRERGRERFVQQLRGELQLTDQQVARIDAVTKAREQKMAAIWAEVQPRIHALIEETRAEVDSVLTPAQRAKMQELRRQHEAARKAEQVARDTGAPKDTATPKR